MTCPPSDTCESMNGSGKSRLCILIPSLGARGAERVATILANGLTRRGHQIVLVSLIDPQEPFYPLLDSVRALHVW